MSDTTTYEIERKGGDKLRVTVPSDWKVTYGPVIGEMKYGGESGNCLRFYESKDKQRALFTRVEAFRDLAIPCEKRVTKRESSEDSTTGPKGSKAKASAVVTHEWEAA